MKYTADELVEAKLIAHRFGFRVTAVLGWMQARGIKNGIDIMKKFGGTMGKSFDESMELINRDVWKWMMETA